MSKQKKSRKNKQYTPSNHSKQQINEMLPPGHRFDKEIADTCSNILLRVQMRRLEKPTSVERELRKEIKCVIAQKKLSRVSINFFDSIINICEINPFVRAATRLLDATYKEYVSVEAYMSTLTDISMQQRISSLINELRACSWHIEPYNYRRSNLII